MTHSDMIKKIQDTFDLEYTEAKALLLENNWDLLDAAIAFERKKSGVYEDVTADARSAHDQQGDKSTTQSEQTYADDATYTTQQEEQRHKESTSEKEAKQQKKEAGGFFDWLKRVYRKGKIHELVVTRKGNTLFTVKLTTLFWILVIFARTFILPVVFVLSLFFDVRYRIDGPGETTKVNRVLSKISDWTSQLFRKDKREDKNTRKNG